MPTELYSHPNKPLIQHLEAVADSAEKAIASIPWTDAALGQMLQRVARIIGLYHDIGKGTTYFQEYLAGNMNFNKRLTNHALLSSIATFLALRQYLSNSGWGSLEDREVMASIGSEQAAIVQEIFSLRAERWTMQAIATKLNGRKN
jgi:CRISPR-associated endonuclease Cas3-HD